jgi:hypothetical protein
LSPLPESARAPTAATIGIVTPGPRHSHAGNRITALRWAGLLRGLGHRVFVEQEWSGRACDALVALHAVKSAKSVELATKTRPDLPIIVLLTGTDLYGEIAQEPVAYSVLARADRLAVLQPRALAELPDDLR